DDNFRLALGLRRRLYMAIRGKHRSGSAVRDLGGSISEFVLYISEQFSPGMVWENWGRGEGKWHLDHKAPLASFDLTDREEFLRAAHYTNYQPLWEGDNLTKGARTFPGS